MFSSDDFRISDVFLLQFSLCLLFILSQLAVAQTYQFEHNEDSYEDIPLSWKLFSHHNFLLVCLQTDLPSKHKPFSQTTALSPTARASEAYQAYWKYLYAQCMKPTPIHTQSTCVHEQVDCVCMGVMMIKATVLTPPQLHKICRRWWWHMNKTDQLLWKIATVKKDGWATDWKWGLSCLHLLLAQRPLSNQSHDLTVSFPSSFPCLIFPVLRSDVCLYSLHKSRITLNNHF